MKARGFSADIIDQVAQAGVDTGVPMAQQLLTGGATYVRELNSLQSQIGSTSSMIGNQQAQQTYGAAISTDQSTVARMTGQENLLDARMASLGKRLQTTLIHALAGEGALNPYLVIGEQITKGVESTKKPKAKARGPVTGPADVNRHPHVPVGVKAKEADSMARNEYHITVPQSMSFTLADLKNMLHRLEVESRSGRRS